MPMPEACLAAARIANEANPTFDNPKKDRWKYVGVMGRDDVPVRVSPTVEVEWVAFSLSKLEPEYSSAPSKVAATWLRRLRLNKALKAKFWDEIWHYYIESRLSLELKAGAPPSAKKVARGGKTDAEVQGSIDKMGSRDV